jgi:hypothetical protein
MTWPLNHSGLMLANLTTLAYFSVSPAMRLPNPDGVPGNLGRKIFDPATRGSR